MEREILELKTMVGDDELYIAVDEIAAINFTRKDDNYIIIKFSLKNGKKKEALFKVKNDKQYSQLRQDIIDKFKGKHNINDYLK